SAVFVTKIFPNSERRGMVAPLVCLVSCVLRSSLRGHSRAFQPIFEARRAKLGVITRYDTALGQLSAEVACAWISDNLARIVVRTESLPNKFVKTKRLWSSDFNGPIQR